jgi:hypothetical protein
MTVLPYVYGEGLLATAQYLNLKDNLLSSIRSCLFGSFPATLSP